MAKIVFFETEPWEEAFLKEKLQGDVVYFSQETLEPGKEYDDSVFNAEILCVFAFSQVTKDILEKFKNLTCIVTRSTGYDHIDVQYCKEKRITVCNVPAYGVHTIAEHTFALILAISRKLVQSVEQTRKGNFELQGLDGFELFEKTLGIVGTGNIGSVVAHIGMGFGMKVVAYNRHEDQALKDTGVTFLPLEEVLKQADIVSLHVPYVAETKHIVNRENIMLFKKGSILINTARGPLVETQAILDGLEKGILAGAGLDVLEEECGLREERELLSSQFLQTCDLRTQLLDHILINRPDVIVTPHNAFHSKEAVQQILANTVADIQGFLKGEPQNVVS